LHWKDSGITGSFFVCTVKLASPIGDCVHPRGVFPKENPTCKGCRWQVNELNIFYDAMGIDELLEFSQRNALESLCQSVSFARLQSPWRWLCPLAGFALGKSFTQGAFYSPPMDDQVRLWSVNSGSTQRSCTAQAWGIMQQVRSKAARPGAIIAAAPGLYGQWSSNGIDCLMTPCGFKIPLFSLPSFVS
jgi:hypothetical protein